MLVVARGVAEESYLSNERITGENLLADSQDLWTN